MIDKLVKSNLSGLRGDYSFPDKVRQKFGLSTLLKSNAGSWTDVQSPIDAYFVNILVWEDSGEKYLQLLSDGLHAFSRSTCENVKVRSYAEQVSSFLSKSSIIRKDSFYYKLKATEAEVQRQEVLAKLQEAATGAALSNIGASVLRKRTFDDVLSYFLVLTISYSYKSSIFLFCGY